MKKRTFGKLKSAALLLALIAGLCVLTENFTAQTVKAQSTINNGSGPQDGGDGKKKPRPPIIRPTLTTQTPSEAPMIQNQTSDTANSDLSESGWLQNLYDWIFG